MNHLKNEKSPYLLQHAGNPVDWYPWCREAFEKAERRDVPVFLSIGYSVCHWCHVMARESFEDREVAEILNRSFISVKVDREERPDVDSVYMSVCQAMTGSGGWPLTVIMTPQKEPFFAGTYFPKNSRPGMAGLTDILKAVEKEWSENRPSLTEHGKYIAEVIRARSQEDENGEAAPSDPEELIRRGLEYFSRTFDTSNGGFGRAPRFPSPHNLLFLLEEGSGRAVSMAEKTLIQMYRGGISDHIGGGFCRYSTDEKWLIPHFEKMLYDNALLLMAYAQAAHASGKTLYGRIADRIVRYVLRELTDRDGGFYCSQDADAEGEEGSFYVFTPEEIRTVLGKVRGDEFCRRFDITEKGNFEGKSVPSLLQSDDFETMPEDYVLLLLYRYRAGRMPLHKDDKILTGWNGLMTAALARASRQLKRPEYLAPALRSADFIWNHLRREDGRLLSRWRDGDAGIEGILDDYAFYCWGLLECYAASFDAEYLRQADLIGRSMLKLFFDEQKGGCWLYAEDVDQLFVRPKETWDGAMPSGNSAALLVMSRLSRLTGDNLWLDACEKQRSFMLSAAADAPQGSGCLLWQLVHEQKDSSVLICCAASPEAAGLQRLQNLDMDILLLTADARKVLAETVPRAADYPIPASGAMYYLCKGHQCLPPVDSPEKVLILAGQDR
ncbi:MAG: thioredoxin domain-containing protein [Emergencia sp.]